MNPKSNQSTSTKLQRRINELYDDKQGCKPLDRGLFPALMAPFGPGDAMKMLRWSLGPTVGAAFAANLRVHIACLYKVLSDADVDEPARTQDHDRLRASMCEAIAHIEAWTERHGIKVCGTLVEDAAALRGWPDETGQGWTPPWDILAIDRPYYWATGSGQDFPMLDSVPSATGTLAVFSQQTLFWPIVRRDIKPHIVEMRRQPS